MFEVKVRGDFAAAHILRGYEGNCKNLHGHTWKVEVTIPSPTLDSIGMVMDFKVVKKKLKELLDRLDHIYLNGLPAFQEINPTTENLAKYIFEEFSKECQPLVIKQVQVWESDLCSVVYYL